MSKAPPSYQLLEINVISAQDLAQVSKPVRAYAVAWVHPDRKLVTQTDVEGDTNPTWNEKFVFRVDNNFLNSEKNSIVMIEIYSSVWLREVLIGTVGVLVSNFLPPNRKPKLSFVALQIRRPSGRPQGILNIGVALLDSTMRSMPLYSELSSSTADDDTCSYSEKHSLLTMQRSRSDDNDSTINDYAHNGYGYDEDDSEVGVPKGGFFNAAGPSPSVVAAKIMKGCYPMLPPPPPGTAESSTLDGWSESNSTATEGMNTKIQRWRSELSPAYEDYEDERQMLKPTPKRVGKTPRRGGGRGGPCSCFGTVFGVEISITVGGGNRGKRNGSGKGRVTGGSEHTLDNSYN